MQSEGSRSRTYRTSYGGYTRLGMLAIILIALILLILLIMKSRSLAGSIESYKIEYARAQENLDKEMARTLEIEQLRQYMQTDEYAEQVAREKLGLVKDQEIIFEEVK